MKKTFQKLASFAVAFAMVFGLNLMTAEAAAPQDASDNMTRQKIGVASDHNFVFTLPTTTAADIDITFPAGFDLTGASSGDGSIAGQVFTITGGVTGPETFDVTISNVINPGTEGTYSIDIATDVDSGSVLVPVITEDQIFVNAVVAQTLTFDVIDSDDDDNTVGFGTLDSGQTRYATTDEAGATGEVADGSSRLIAATNASSGYVIDVDGDTLESMENPGTFIAAYDGETPSAGSEGFGLTVDAVGGAAGTIATSYTGTNYDLNDTPGTPDVLITRTAPTNSETYGVNYVADIAGLTPAGQYSTAITYTMTANF